MTFVTPRGGSLRTSLLCLGALGTLAWAALSPATALAQPGSASSSPAPARVASELEAYLDRIAKESAFSGAVLVAKDGKVVFERAYGEANHAFRIPNNLDTKFNLGSMGKMFTAVAILQLVEQGKLTLDDPVSKVLPDYPDQDIARRITIRQLLSHTSGLGNMFNAKYEATPKGRLDSNQAHQALFSGEPLLFEPGSRFEYSNAGYIVLGLIIEEVSGQGYYDYVRDHVFKPAGMTGTDNFKPHDDVPNLAVGYTTMTGMGQAASPVLITNADFLARGTSAGGGYSTVRDLLRFAEALQAGRLVGKASVEMAVKGVTTMPTGETYGLGMMSKVLNGVRYFGHGGGAPGISSNLDIFPGSGYVAAVMTNIDGGARPVAERMRALLSGQEAPRAVQLSADALKVFAGVYLPEPPPGLPPRTLEITVGSKGLTFTDRRGKHDFAPVSGDEFVNVDNPSGRIIFQRDASGRVIGATLNGVVAPPGIVVKAQKQS